MVVLGQPVILSLLVDPKGLVQGYRIITDPHAEEELRMNAYTIAVAFKARLGTDGWTCEDLPPGAGETPIAGVFVKERCRKTAEGQNVVVESRYYYKPGQALVDPNSGLPTVNQFGALFVNPNKIFDSGQFQDEILFGTDRVYLTRTGSTVWDPLSQTPLSSQGGLITTVTSAPTRDDVPDVEARSTYRRVSTARKTVTSRTRCEKASAPSQPSSRSSSGAGLIWPRAAGTPATRTFIARWRNYPT